MGVPGLVKASQASLLSLGIKGIGTGFRTSSRLQVVITVMRALDMANLKAEKGNARVLRHGQNPSTVSYTHLTLPTKRIV